MAVSKEHFSEVIAHLSSKKAYLLEEVSAINASLEMLIKEEQRVGAQQKLIQTDKGNPEVETPVGPYATISVRWAVLSLLAERVDSALSLGEITEALRAGGSATKAQNFSANVSAVLSQMVGKGELQRDQDGFRMAEQGRGIWNGISKSEKFLQKFPEPA